MPEAVRVLPPLERLLYLKRAPLLAGLAASELLALAEAASERYVAKGSVLFREQDAASSLHLVVEGTLAHSRYGERLATLGPGAGVGELPVLARSAMGSRAEAETDALTLEIDADALAEVLEDRFQIVQYLLRELSRRALELVRRKRLDPASVFPEPSTGVIDGGGGDLVDRLLLLRRMPVFERTSVTALAELARAMANVRYEAGTWLWHEGEPSERLALVTSGRVEASGTGGVSFTAGPGFPLGGLEAVAQAPRWFDARALTPVVALQAPTDVLVDLFEDNFEMAMDYLALLAAAALRVESLGSLQPRGEVD